jgi:hypothetical protein
MTSPNTPQPRARTVTRSIALWMFGVFTTVLLIGLWGRSVATDQATLESSVDAVLESEIVHDRIAGWLGEGLAAATTLAPADIAETVTEVAQTDAFDRAMDEIVDDIVDAALAPADQSTTIDLGAALDELVPITAESLAEAGVETDAEQLGAELEAAPSLVLAAEELPAVGGTARRAAGALTRVMVIGIIGMLSTGIIAVAAADERVRQVRQLTVRIGISAITFAIILRASGWAVDPQGGRSPIAKGGAELLSSNSHVLGLVALAAGAAAGLASLAMLGRRGTGVARPRLFDSTEAPAIGPD